MKVLVCTLLSLLLLLLLSSANAQPNQPGGNDMQTSRLPVAARSGRARNKLNISRAPFADALFSVEELSRMAGARKV